MSDPAFAFDYRFTPIVIVRVSGVATDEEFTAYLDQLTEDIRTHDRLVHIYDARTSGRTPGTQRRMQAEWMAAHKDVLVQKSLGTAFVFSSAIQRFVLSSIFLISPIPGPYTIKGTVAEACAWGLEKLHDAGIRRPKGFPDVLLSELEPMA